MLRKLLSGDNIWIVMHIQTICTAILLTNVVKYYLKGRLPNWSFGFVAIFFAYFFASATQIASQQFYPGWIEAFIALGAVGLYGLARKFKKERR